MKNVSVLIIFFFLLISNSLFGDGIIPFQYEGCWASNEFNKDGVENTTFLSIQRFKNSDRFIVISHSTWNKRFVFLGGGHIRNDGFLEIHTLDEKIWLLTPGYSANFNETFSISNLTNEESFDTFYRLDEKYDEWPFK